jgi:hypothetical protein
LIRRNYPSGKGVVLRLVIGESGEARLSVVVTTGEGTVVLKKTESASAQAVSGFLTILERSNFWSLPTSEVDEPPLIRDGAIWAIEGIRDGSYHIVYRRNPKPSRYTEVGRYLAKDLARLDDSTFFAEPAN